MGLVVHNAPLCALPVPPHEPIETRHQPRRRDAMMRARPKRPRLQAPTPMGPLPAPTFGQGIARTMPVRLQLSRPFLPQSLRLCSTLRFAPSSQSKHLHFTLYRCTQSVTYTASYVFAVGYAYSAALAPPRVADSRSPKPSRKPDRGPPVSAPAILSRQTRSDGCRGSLSPFPGEGGRPWRKRCPRRSLRSWMPIWSSLLLAENEPKRTPS